MTTGDKIRAAYCWLLSFFAIIAAVIADDTPTGYLLVRGAIVALVLIFWCWVTWPPSPRK